MRLVLDTNVLISAAIVDGNARRLLMGVLANHVLLESDATLRELRRVLQYPRFRLNEEEIAEFLVTVVAVCHIVEATTALRVVTADPDDDRFLELAVDGRADAIVSGDKHLLGLGSFQGIPVLTVRQALDWLS